MNDDVRPFPVIALISMICGIVALMGHGCCCVPYLNMIGMLTYPLAALCLIAAMITGAIGLSQARATEDSTGIGLSVVGLVCSVLSLALLATIVALNGLGALVAIVVIALGG